MVHVWAANWQWLRLVHVPVEACVRGRKVSGFPLRIVCAVVDGEGWWTLVLEVIRWHVVQVVRAEPKGYLSRTCMCKLCNKGRDVGGHPRGGVTDQGHLPNTYRRL